MMEDNGIEYQEEVDQDIVEEPLTRKRIEARIYLREERALAVQDLLYFIYPNLELSVTWANVSDLLLMSRKFDMPLLRKHCMVFLNNSAAGKPIQAMKLAEEHIIPDVYKEASRFLLDKWVLIFHDVIIHDNRHSYSHWDQNELAILTEGTLLKLEKRRSYFLERLLKLGLINPLRDYVCCITCPDPLVRTSPRGFI